jgi:hypothetical protein
MKKITMAVFVFMLSCGLVLAQSADRFTKKADRTDVGGTYGVNTYVKAMNPQPEVTIWDEDFANGIPGTWVNAGFDGFGNVLDSALWEFRGPNTNPPDSVGSRGAYWGTRSPIQSATPTTFVIFDSDYLDNAGVAGNFGNGKAPAPHVGTLTTGVINTTGYNNVGLRFHSYHRYFEGRALVAFSTDGGTTWTDTLAAHPGISVNAESDPAGTVELNVSSIIGNSSNVKIRFIFDGTFDDPGANGSGQGYYFWMIDDVEVYEIPQYDIRFTSWNGAPAQDFISGPATGSSKTGIMCIVPPPSGSDQTRNITFDANAFNFGFGTLNNVKLDVTILDINNTLVTKLSSTASVNLSTGDTATYNDLNTYNNPYKPTQAGVYRFYYEAISDSAIAVSDTFEFFVTDTILGIDWDSFNNSLGTENLGDDGSAIGARLDLVDFMSWKAVWVGLSSLTQPGSTIEIEIYDTAGFDFLTGFPASNLIATGVSSYTITQQDIDNGYVQLPITDGTNPYVALPNDSYFAVARMYSNAGSNILRIRNDQSFPQPALSSIMYNTDDARWYTGYSNSLTLNAPHIRAIAFNPIGLEEEQLENAVRISPNPASTHIDVAIADFTGEINLTICDVNGRLVHDELIDVYDFINRRIDVSDFAGGMYLLTINNGKAQISKRVVVH